IKPDVNNDWVNQRDENYLSYPTLFGDLLSTKGVGVKTNRDAWVYNFSKHSLEANSSRMIDNYNFELERLKGNKNILENINMSNDFIKWSDGLKNSFKNGKKLTFNSDKVKISMYRPFTKKYLYYDNSLIERPGIWNKFDIDNLQVMYTTGI